MTRREFMQRLEQLLKDLPEHDRQDALAYYEDYFDEAGPENEENLIRDLGSPEKVAETIKRGAKSGGNEQAEYSECGYSDGQKMDKQPPVKKKTGRKPFPLAIIIILLIFGLPVWGGLLSGLFGAVVGILGAILGILIAIAAVTAAGIVGGAVVFGVSLFKMIADPVTGILGIGIGSILMAIGLLLLIFFLWIILKAFPAVFRMVVNLIQKLIYKIRGGVQNE